jgi:hypothetical protein
MLLATLVFLVIPTHNHVEGPADRGWLGYEPTFDRSRLPLHVCAHEYGASPIPTVSAEALQVLQAATKRVNRQLGGNRELFLVSEDGCDVFMLLGAPMDDRAPSAVGLQWFESMGGEPICMISTHTEMSRAVHSRVISHELGHCIGLEHDAIPLSIMYPSVVRNVPQVFTKADRIRVVARYFD